MNAEVSSQRWLAILVACLLIACWEGAHSNAEAQAASHADANQLHAAIVNGDVESLRYWLTVRHADASAARAAEPDVTPLQRCLGLASRVLDAPPAADRPSNDSSNPPVGLRTLQTMVTLLHEHGARITEADRLRFSGPVLRWYDDAVSPPPAPPVQPAAAPPQTAAASANQPVVSLRLKPVFLMMSPRESCNGGGHAVYLVNQSQLSVTAKVTMFEASEKTNDTQKSDTYTVNPDSSWRLGCDTSRDGRSVRYVLDAWR